MHLRRKESLLRAEALKDTEYLNSEGQSRKIPLCKTGCRATRHLDSVSVQKDVLKLQRDLSSILALLLCNSFMSSLNNGRAYAH